MGLVLNTKTIPYFVITGLLIYIFMISNSDSQEIIIPSKSNTVYIDNPIEVKVYDTIYRDSIIKKEVLRVVEVESKPNQELLKKYEDANDSILKLELFISAIKERSYIEKLEDSVQTITVKSSVIGTLKSQSISYVTKPITIKKKVLPSIYVGGSIQLTTKDGLTPSASVNISVAGKKTIYSIGINSNKAVFVSAGIRIFNPHK